MIPSLRSGDYRNIRYLLYSLPLNPELKQMLSFIYDWWIIRALFLMVFSLRGGYQSFCNLPYLITSYVENVSKNSYVLSARATFDHLLVEDFAKPVFMVESAMV
ncbi:unnamed protein product [Arabidopsis thaliana]|uniref:(thale cress) hypothetical protein n=1 Tax=Arabidopsis thaliana TaxID=3702 RepID=A0A7G2EWG2_ARATH|nr:unnamed protein product [Arabidopsis thaliana]